METSEADTLLVATTKGVKKLKNPYSLANMKTAFENIRAQIRANTIRTKGDISGTEVRASHYYIKFSPTTAEQEGKLKSDSTMFLADYPLDYDFTDEYLDNRPPLAEGEFSEYWVAVPVEKTLPKDVPYEVLEELYIPEEDPKFSSSATSSTHTERGKIQDSEDLLRHVLNEAYTLTGNEADLIQETPQDSTARYWIFGRKWTPSGTINIWDEAAGYTITTKRVFSHWEYYDCGGGSDFGEIDPILEPQKCRRAIYRNVSQRTRGKYVPLQGAQVLIRQWFTVRQGITDSRGHFRTRSIRGRARYILQWERYHYSIRSGAIGQAETRGIRTNHQQWNYNIKGGTAEYYGHIHRAALDYYYGSRFGLHSPPTNSLLKTQMKISAFTTDGRSSHIHQRRWIHLAQIYLKVWGKPSDQVYGVTIHELAHAARWALDKTSYNDLVWDGYISDAVLNGGRVGDVRTLETWATTVEILFALSRYRDALKQPKYKYGERNGLSTINFQLQTIASQNFYTSAGFDMIDNINQRSVYGSVYPLDRVSGYTAKQIEDGLRGAKGWLEWKNNIKARSSNPTEKYLDELFNNWK